jgi:hypothetical protein
MRRGISEATQAHHRAHAQEQLHRGDQPRGLERHQQQGGVLPMKMFYVSVWLEQDKDNDEPNYKYVRFTKQRYSTAHTRLTNEAIKKFRDWGRITVEVQG